MKIARIADITPDLNKISGLSANLPNTGVFSPSGIKQINLIITNIREMVKEAKEINNPVEKVSARDNDSMINAETKGLTKQQLFDFAKQFLDNLIKQGYGDKTPAETISDIPLSIKQLRGLL